jgi:prepilin-type N-terminal cleavage/methylation domain-containing protein/prepilin-type processing-associated H-X9-DG protein
MFPSSSSPRPERALRARHSSGFTLIELLVVIAIIALLAAILFPVFARARENARRASCMSNLKQIGLGIHQYTQDYDEKMPPPFLRYSSGYPNDGNATYAPVLILPYVKSDQIWYCPSAPKPDADHTAYIGFPSYGINVLMGADPGVSTSTFGIALSAINNPAELINAIESSYLPNAATWPGYYAAWYDGASTPYTTYNNNVGVPYPRHFEGANALFCDGHVKWNKVETYTTAPSTPTNWRLWYPDAP